MLTDKHILVIGAAGLIGRGLVTELVNQGAKVYAADISFEGVGGSVKTANWSDNSIERILLDITNQDQVKSTFSQIDKLDGVVNSAYPRNASYGKHFFDVSLNDFNDNVSLQLGSAFSVAQACAKYFSRYKNRLSLVNLSSIYGVIAPQFDIYENTQMTMPVEYAAVKSGLIHLTKYVVNYVNNSDFRANCVSPGGIYAQQSSEFVEQYTKHTHGRGMLDAQDVFGTIVFLLSEQSRYITGQNIVVDDGFSL